MRRSRSRGSIGSSFLSSGVSGTEEWPDRPGDYDRALAALSEGLALAEKVGDDAFVPRIRNTLGWLRIDCGDFASGIELSERSYEETNRSSRAGHGTGAERRAFIRINEGGRLDGAGGLRAARRGAGGGAPHRPAPAALALDDLAVLGALLREPRPARASQGDPERARRLADQSLETAVPTRLAEVRELGVADQGRERHARRAWDEAEDALGRARALAETIGQPRQTWMSHLGPRAPRRGAGPTRGGARGLPCRVDHHRRATRAHSGRSAARRARVLAPGPRARGPGPA